MRTLTLSGGMVWCGYSAWRAESTVPQQEVIYMHAARTLLSPPVSSAQVSSLTDESATELHPRRTAPHSASLRDVGHQPAGFQSAADGADVCHPCHLCPDHVDKDAMRLIGCC